MSTIKGKGIPTRNTKGAIGDTYVDSSSGRQYKCVNAYGALGQFEYTWKPMKNEQGKVEVKETKPAKPVAEKKVEVKPVEEPKAEPVVEEKVEEVVEEPVKEEVKETKQRTNYAAAYNKKSK
jgi:hypothetical protein